MASALRPGNVCYCDPNCITYDDCCHDYKSACRGAEKECYTETTEAPAFVPFGELAVGEASQVNALSTSYGPTPPYEAREAQGVALQGRLWVFGGFVSPFWFAKGKRTRSYDPLSKRWTFHTPMPLGSSVQGISHMGNAADSSTIYLVGGLQADVGSGWPDCYSIREAYSFRPFDQAMRPIDRWAQLPDLPDQRAAGAAAVVDRTLHFMGGGRFLPKKKFVQDYRDHWGLDLDNVAAGWRSLASIPVKGRNHLGSVAYAGKIYLFGGQTLENEHTDNYALAHVFLPGQNTWKPLKPMPWAMGHIGPSVMAWADLLVVVGGKSNGWGNHPNAAMYYDPSTDSWGAVNGAPDKIRQSSQVSGVVGNTLYVQSHAALFTLELSRAR